MNCKQGMEKREKTLFLIAGILFVFSCLNFLRTLTALADFLDILAFLSTGFIAVILFMKRKDWFLGIALGVNALICLISFVQLLPFQGFSLVGFLEFLFPALLCAVIFFEKQIAPFKKPLMLVCAYLSAASLLLIIKDYAGVIEPVRFGGYAFVGSRGYLNLLFNFIGAAINAFGFICITAILAHHTYGEKNEKLNKVGLIGFIALPVGIILGFLTALISFFIGGRVHLFDIPFTGILWAIIIAIIVIGICLSPLAILYPAKPRMTTNIGVDMSDGYIGLGKHIVLCLFTFGIWYWIWIYRTTAYLNRTPNAEQYNPTSKLLLFIFVPFYSIYWYYKHGGRIDTLSHSRNLNYSDTATMCLVLGIFIPIVACILMQDRINSLCTATNIANNFSAPQQEEKQFENIKQLKELLDSGIITQEEFEAKKKQLLGL